MNPHCHDAREIHFGNKTEMSFSVLWNGYATDADAKAARDSKYRELRAVGLKASRTVLRGQVRQYWSLGNPCGDSCNVYKLRWSNAL